MMIFPAGRGLHRASPRLPGGAAIRRPRRHILPEQQPHVPDPRAGPTIARMNISIGFGHMTHQH